MSNSYCDFSSIQYLNTVADSVCVLLPANDWWESMISCDQLFRRLAQCQVSRNDMPKRKRISRLCVIIESNEGNIRATEVQTIVAALKQAMGEYWRGALTAVRFKVYIS